MKDYQIRYIENLNRILELADVSRESLSDTEAFFSSRYEKRRTISSLITENTALLRQELFPALDDVITLPPEEILSLREFASALRSGGRELDIVLTYTIHNALLVYARHQKKRDLLIEELYWTGMSLYSLHSLIRPVAPNRYTWRMQNLFGEAASYIKEYDSIEDPGTRGYIHRSMANMALSYMTGTREMGERKMRIIRNSLRILTDPVYHRKTPSLPWDTYIYKSHQERTTSLAFLRSSADSQMIREVMESAEYVWQKQLEISRATGAAPSTRWHVVYELAHYHCGILTLEQLLTRMERLFLERRTDDYSMEGIYCNIYLPAVYAEYLSYNEQYKQSKKEVLGYMYRMMLAYVRTVPASCMGISMIRNIMMTFINFIEYPDGLKQRDLLLRLVVCRNPETFVYFHMTACLSKLLLTETLRVRPELLLGVLDLDTEEALLAQENRLAEFAYEAGMFHDIGQLNFTQMTTQTGRSWMSEEKELYKYHPQIGESILRRCESTRLCADAAAGHHRYYDGKGGYPETYDRNSRPNQPVTDIVALCSYFCRLLDNTLDYKKPHLSLEEALAQLRSESGARLHPGFVRIFCDMEPTLRHYLETARLTAYRLAVSYLYDETPSPI